MTIPGTTHWNGCNNKEIKKTKLLVSSRKTLPRKKLSKGLDYSPRVVSRSVVRTGLSIPADNSQFFSIFLLINRQNKHWKILKSRKNMHSKTANSRAYRRAWTNVFRSDTFHNRNPCFFTSSFFFSSLLFCFVLFYFVLFFSFVLRKHSLHSSEPNL